MCSVFVDVDGHKHAQTSSSVVGNKIQTNRYRQGAVRNSKRKFALLINYSEVQSMYCCNALQKNSKSVVST